MSLSTGAVSALTHADEDNPIASEPVIQILSVKKVVSASVTAPDRYRLVISDGEYFMQAMLSTQLNELVSCDPPQIDKNTVLKLLTYATNIVGNRRIVIALTVEVLHNPGSRIGTPATIDNAAVPAAAPAADVQMQDVKPAVPAARGGGGGSNASAAAKKGGAAQNKSKGGNQSGMSAPIYPIEGLSPYQNKWTIKARCTVKSDIRHWSNAKGDGKLFSVNLLDETGEIKATGFNDEVDNLAPKFEEGKVYYISKARVNIAKKQFSNLSSEYEITFGRDTEVELCEDQDSAPQIKYSFVELSDLANLEKDATCDVLGIVVENGDLGEITTKATQKQLKKREVTIADRSGYQVRVTLWGKSAESWEDSDHGVVAIKGARVGDFGGRTLSMGGGSTMSTDPDIPEAHELRGWYDTEGNSKQFVGYSGAGSSGSGGPMKKEDFRTLESVKEDESLGQGEKPDFFNARATVILIKSENLSYPACPSEKCNKKVSMEGNDQWRCEKCDHVYAAPEYRYIMQMCISDYTNQIWISGFNDVGVTVLGKTADEMYQMKEDDEGAFNQVISQAQGKMYDLTLRAKAETYGDQTSMFDAYQPGSSVRTRAAAFVRLSNELGPQHQAAQNSIVRLSERANSRIMSATQFLMEDIVGGGRIDLILLVLTAASAMSESRASSPSCRSKFFLTDLSTSVDTMTVPTIKVFVANSTGNLLLLALGAAGLHKQYPDLVFPSRAGVALATSWLSSFVTGHHMRYFGQRRRIWVMGELGKPFAVRSNSNISNLSVNKSKVFESLLVFISVILLYTNSIQLDNNTNLVFIGLLGWVFGALITKTLGVPTIPAQVVTGAMADLLSDANLFAPIRSNIPRNQRAGFILVFFGFAAIGGTVLVKANAEAVVVVTASLKLLTALLFFWVPGVPKKMVMDAEKGDLSASDVAIVKA
ncbi:replication factor A1, partial [Phenoliferia sp. Uapishka_3]